MQYSFHPLNFLFYFIYLFSLHPIHCQPPTPGHPFSYSLPHLPILFSSEQGNVPLGVRLTSALQVSVGLGTSLPLKQDKAAQLEEHIPCTGTAFGLATLAVVGDLH